LTVPKAKGQRGQKPEKWEITADLAREIDLYSARPGIREMQQKHDRLLVWDTESFQSTGTISTGSVGTMLAKFMASAQLTSQRDNNFLPRPLKFNARRARHTTATQMAF